MQTLLLTLLPLVHGLFHKHPTLPPVIFGRPPGGPLKSARYLYSNTPWINDTSVVDQYFTQKNDHFDDASKETFQQRFWHNSAFAKGEIDLVFVVLGGMETLDASCTTDKGLQHVQWAIEFGAHVVCLEHRFAGKSLPLQNGINTGVFSKLLTVKQASRDVAEFILANKLGFNYSRWMLFGASYGGYLAARVNEEYHGLFIGTVASSAPVRNVEEFQEFSNVVQTTLDGISVGNIKCSDGVRLLADNIVAMVDTQDGRIRLNDKLMLDPPFDNANLGDNFMRDKEHLLNNIYGLFQLYGLYAHNVQAFGTADVATTMCQKIFTPPKPLDGFNDFLHWYNEMYSISKDNKFPNSYHDTVETLKIDGAGDAELQENRAWLWLSCNELGMFSGPSGNGIFGKLSNLQVMMNLCMDVFSTQFPNLPETPNDFNGYDIMLTYGARDPFSPLGQKQENAGTNVRIQTIDGAGHCADVVSGSPGTEAVHAATKAFIQERLTHYMPTGTPVTSPPTSPNPIQPTTHYMPTGTPVTGTPTSASPNQPTNPNVMSTPSTLQPSTQSAGTSTVLFAAVCGLVMNVI